MKYKSIISVFIFSFFLFFTGSAAAQDTTGTAILQKKFERLSKKKNYVLLDVRTPGEYQAGYIGDAVNYDVQDSLQFLQQMAPLDKKKKYLLYCKSGRRSGKALMMMKEMGFKKVYHLSGGISIWHGELSKPE